MSLPRLLPTALFAALPLFAAADDSSTLDADERVVLFPTAAALASDGASWRLPLSGCVFEPEDESLWRDAVTRSFRGILTLATTAEERKLAESRLRLFLVDHQRNERFEIAIGARRFLVGPTAPNGHADAFVELPIAAAELLATDGVLPITVPAHQGVAAVAGRVHLVGPEGLSVISDLDDTVKITDVRDKTEALRNTFLRDFRPVAGMPELYQRIALEGAKATPKSRVAFHYVSLSPWQLAPLLDEFLARSGLPAGSLHLQHFRVKDGDFADLTGDSREKKLAAIEPLLATWPRRHFVLFGDSGQKDPETYGELARRHPQQIAAIVIRDVTAEPAESPRYAAAFADLPRAKWQLFIDPAMVAV